MEEPIAAVVFFRMDGTVWELRDLWMRVLERVPCPIMAYARQKLRIEVPVSSQTTRR